MHVEKDKKLKDLISCLKPDLSTLFDHPKQTKDRCFTSFSHSPEVIFFKPKDLGYLLN